MKTKPKPKPQGESNRCMKMQGFQGADLSGALLTQATATRAVGATLNPGERGITVPQVHRHTHNGGVAGRRLLGCPLVGGEAARRWGRTPSARAGGMTRCRG
jgi:hypothetical protein